MLFLYKEPVKVKTDVKETESAAASNGAAQADAKEAENVEADENKGN